MKQKRRSFIKTASGFLCGFLLAPNTFYGRALSSVTLPPIEPATISAAISVVQFAIGAAKLFKGSSTSGISDLQIKMLENLSKQLKEVQVGIAEILTKLNEVKKLIKSIPDEVVNEISAVNLQASILQYEQAMRIYRTYNGDNGKYLRERRKDLEDLIKRISDHSSVLMTKDSYLNIPLVSAALHMEYSCNRLINEKESKVLEVIKTYQNYLVPRLAALEKEILSLRSEQLKLKDAISKIYPLEARVLSTFGTGAHYFVTGSYSYQESVVPPTDEAYNNSKALKTIGLLEKDDYHISVKPNIIYDPINGRLTDDFYRYNGQVDKNGYMGMQGRYFALGTVNSINILPLLRDEKIRINNEAKKLEEDLNLTTSKIFSAVSCFYAGNRALNFCQQFFV